MGPCRNLLIILCYYKATIVQTFIFKTKNMTIKWLSLNWATWFNWETIQIDNLTDFFPSEWGKKNSFENVYSNILIWNLKAIRIKLQSYKLTLLELDHLNFLHTNMLGQPLFPQQQRLHQQSLWCDYLQRRKTNSPDITNDGSKQTFASQNNTFHFFSISRVFQVGSILFLVRKFRWIF